VSAGALPLPRWPYRPGCDVKPDRATLDAILQHAAPDQAGWVSASNDLVRHGLVLNDAGFFWEAHEVLEAVWKAARKGGIDRIVLRGCIQIANANLKSVCGEPRAAGRLVAEALADFEEVRRRGSAPAGSFAAAFDPARLEVGQRTTPILLQRGWT